MIESIKLENTITGDVIFLDKMTTPDYVLDVVDWGVITSNHHSYKYVNQIGVYITGTTLETRDITISGWIIAENDMQMTRRKMLLNKMINPKEPIDLFYSSYKLQFVPDTSVKYSITFKENNEVMCKFKIDGMCPNPLFADDKETLISAANIVPMFHFPLAISSNVFDSYAEKIRVWLDGNYNFLFKYTRAELPNALNEDYLASGQFENGLASGDSSRYTPWQAGASETQTLLLRGILQVYKITKEQKWKDFALNMANQMMRVLFSVENLPGTFSGFYYLPHWLYIAKQDTRGDAWYKDKIVSFTNGVASFNSAYIARKIASVRALDATLVWDNPYSTINGTKYDIESYTTDGNKTFIINLVDKSFTGDAKVVYIDSGGPMIQKNTLMESWPFWRLLEDGEIDCAVDGLWWVLDCFDLLYEITEDERWLRSSTYMRETIPKVVDVNDFKDWFISNVGTDNPFSVNGSYWQSTRDGATIIRSTTTGAVNMHFPSGSGWSQYGNYNIDEEWKEDNYLEVVVASNSNGYVKLNIDPSGTYVPNDRYVAIVPFIASVNIQTINLHLTDFVYPDSLNWDIGYTNSGYAIYKDDGSTCIATNAKDGSHAKFDYGVSIYAQMVPGVPWGLTKCPVVKYSANNEVNLRLKDQDGWYWYFNLQPTSNPTLIAPLMQEFTTAGYQPNPGEPPTVFAGVIDEFAFVFSGTGSFSLYRMGTPRNPIVGTKISNVLFYYDSPSSLDYSLYRARFLPQDKVEYAPYIAPFTVNLINNHIQTWRGLPYTGYQAPYFWQEIGDLQGVNMNMEYLKDSQDAYEEKVGIRGPFASAYIWKRWDASDYGPIGSWYQDQWGGFQYRTLEGVARTLKSNPSLTKAVEIFTDFVNWLNDAWPTFSDAPPIVFEGNQLPRFGGEEPHCVALILRSAIYADQSGAISSLIVKPLIKKCLQYLERTYVSDMDSVVYGTWSNNPSEGVWNQFWNGEIIDTLAIAYKYVVIEERTNGVIFGYKQPSLIITVVNNGTIETGFRFVFKATGTVINPKIINVNTQEKFEINKELIGGEEVEINTSTGSKGVKGRFSGVESNYFKYRSFDSVWLTLKPGGNAFRYDADENIENLEVYVYYSSKYLEVQECY